MYECMHSFHMICQGAQTDRQTHTHTHSLDCFYDLACHFNFSALNTCSEELFLKIGTLLPELAVHEKSIDHFIELLRKDQLDENTSTEPLEKSINYFQVQGIFLIYIIILSM